MSRAANRGQAPQSSAADRTCERVRNSVRHSWCYGGVLVVIPGYLPSKNEGSDGECGEARMLDVYGITRTLVRLRGTFCATCKVEPDAGR
jgi:hypothetical protein